MLALGFVLLYRKGDPVALSEPAETKASTNARSRG
jgi:hypothetical protein